MDDKLKEYFFKCLETDDDFRMEVKTILGKPCTMEEAQKACILTALYNTFGSVRQAARICDIDERTFHSKCRRFGIESKKIKKETRQG